MFRGEIGCTFCRRQYQRTATIRHQATLELVKRVGNHSRLQHVRYRDRFSIRRPWIQSRPFPLNDRDRSKLLVRETEFFHVSENADREHRSRAIGSVWHFELSG